jgi:hypothetical protein
LDDELEGGLDRHEEMTLEEIARSIADVYTDRQLPRYLEDLGVPERYLADVEGQGKWEFVLSVLERLHDGGSEARRVLREFIGGWLDGGATTTRLALRSADASLPCWPSRDGMSETAAW